MVSLAKSNKIKGGFRILPTFFPKIRLSSSGVILQECESREIKLFGLLAAAGLIAAHSSKKFPGDQWEKYAVVTLIDCRSILDPVLTSSHHGQFSFCFFFLNRKPNNDIYTVEFDLITLCFSHE